MSFFSNPFTFKRTKQRKAVSKSPLKLGADEMARELGPRCETIDLRVADRKINYDMSHADWNTDGAETIGGTGTKADARRLENQISVLHEENNMLKLKVEVLLNLLAESLAELPGTRS